MNVNEMIDTAERLGGDLPTPITPDEFDEDSIATKRWEICTVYAADWALSRLGEVEAEIASIKEQGEAAKARIDSRVADLTLRANRLAAFFRLRLTEYATKHRTELLGGGKKKSRDFVSGRLGWRKKGGRLRVVDEAALEPWLLAQGVESGLFRLKVEPDKKALQKLLEEQGQVPPGCEYDPEFDDVYVEANAPASALVKG